MAKFHLPRFGWELDKWKFFVEVVREERHSFERHFFPATTDNLETFRQDRQMMVYKAVDVIARRVEILEITHRGAAVIFEGGEFVEGLQT